MRTEFEEFAQAMEKKFEAALTKDEYRSPKPWDDYPATQLIARFKEEANEFLESIHWAPKHSEKAYDGDELLDVANFCLFLWIKKNRAQVVE